MTVAHVAQREHVLMLKMPRAELSELGDYRGEEIKRLFSPHLSFLQPCGWPLR